MKTIFRIITLLCLLFTGDNDSSDFSNRWGYKLTPPQNTTKLYGSNNSDLLCFTAVCNSPPWAISIYEVDYHEFIATGVSYFVYKSSTTVVTVAMCNCTTDLSKSPTDLCINITMLGTPETLNISVQFQDKTESYTIAKISDIKMSSSTSTQTSDPSLSTTSMTNNDSLSNSTPSSTNAPSPSDPSTTTPNGPSTTSSSGPSTTTTSGPSTTSQGNYAAGSHNPTLGITFLMTMLVLFF
ncbi:PREDICTED: cell wall protein DAN4-like isoform X2 [Amphimedon queenslandica]|uniref:Uncharacterized protein n=1 Tax=Amphimedon queenslandica TaxID=400682 RepID=A0AAN0JR98_AMPQE|nr:PREDICTED: cell wall protein DAN4-like isoform X2 [Amphimedon queenslandica]|eukprot:XP_019859362.1 PREDICTED: cell wall protein DAN4-like isoform X2 [Amphimedon queenslandica]